jgi:signal transduction histidine kinase
MATGSGQAGPAEAEGPLARLIVRDEGIGIGPEALERIFGRFERGVSDRQYGGLGLGLYISRELARAMGGEVRVESRLDQGATFTVELPRLPLA